MLLKVSGNKKCLMSYVEATFLIKISHFVIWDAEIKTPSSQMISNCLQPQTKSNSCLQMSETPLLGDLDYIVQVYCSSMLFVGWLMQSWSFIGHI